MKLDIKLWVTTHEHKHGVDAYIFTSEKEMEQARREYANPSRDDEYWDYDVRVVTINTEDYA